MNRTEWTQDELNAKWEKLMLPEISINRVVCDNDTYQEMEVMEFLANAYEDGGGPMRHVVSYCRTRKSRAMNWGGWKQIPEGGIRNADELSTESVDKPSPRSPRTEKT